MIITNNTIMSHTNNTQTKVLSTQLAASVMVLAMGLMGWSAFTLTAAAVEHDEASAYGATAGEDVTPASEVYGGADASDPVQDGGLDTDTPVNPVSAADVVTPDTAAMEAAAEPTQATAETSAMVGTLDSVVQTAQGLQTNVEAGEMEVAEAMSLLADLQAIVDLIEASLAMS